MPMDEKERTTNGLRGGASEREVDTRESVFIRAIRGVTLSATRRAPNREQAQPIANKRQVRRVAHLNTAPSANEHLSRHNVQDHRATGQASDR